MEIHIAYQTLAQVAGSGILAAVALAFWVVR